MRATLYGNARKCPGADVDQATWGLQTWANEAVSGGNRFAVRDFAMPSQRPRFGSPGGAPTGILSAVPGRAMPSQRRK